MFQETPLIQKKNRQQTIARTIFMIMAVLAIIPLITIFIYLFYKGSPALSWEFVSEFPRRRMTEGGIFPAILGTFYMVALSLIIATPIGVLAAVYLNEYAGNNWFTRIVNLAVVNLAGVPSIVHALFGLGTFVMFMNGPCLLAASLTLAIMTLPVIIASTKQALEAVPMSFREASWNLGASKWQTIRTLVLPNSFSGILTGIILQVSRAAGETAPIMFTGALYFRKQLPDSIFDQSMALSMHLYTVATQGSQIPEKIQFGTAIVLLGLVLIINAASISLRVYFRSRKKW